MDEKLKKLKELSLDLNWSWNREIDKVWEFLEKEAWQRTHNPCVVMQMVSQSKLEELLQNPQFCSLLDEAIKGREAQVTAPSWFSTQHKEAPLSSIAYFSMEFMLSESLPIYSGGLGNVAGDQLKAASDLGVPVIAIGILYQQGYFRQMITKAGVQLALYPYNDPAQLPVQPLRAPDGEWVRLEIPFPEGGVWLRAWEVKVGRVKLYLLDSNDPMNMPIHRGLTSELYGGDLELRLKQEIILGIGGFRLLKQLGISPEVCHLNEGHAAFAILERAYQFMQENRISFKEALIATRVGNLFTTHTAVPAGFDRFPPHLMQQYMQKYGESLSLSFQELMALGRRDQEDQSEPFNMAYLAIAGSGAINGVSQLHGKVSRAIFEPLFPRWPECEIPVGFVTNGIHVPSWESEAADRLWTGSCGKERWKEKQEIDETKIQKASPLSIWQMRSQARKQLIDYAREKVRMQMQGRGESEETIQQAKHLFDPNILTLGFARRFATYKRPNMLLQDPERLLRILTDAERPVQLIIAGKAHPADLPGQAMIKEWIEFIQKNKLRSHLIFLSDYDMCVTEELVQGVDVWVNTPRRPWEACGTSGMKVLVNGGLNLSELDGWWVEAYSPQVGWALGDGKEHGDDPAWDKAEAGALYDLLEKEVIPTFYDRNPEGIPTKWIELVKKSMRELTPRFSATRAVTEYTEKYYLPAASNYLARRENQADLARQIARQLALLEENWGNLRFGKTRIDEQSYEIEIYLGEIDPSLVTLELFAAGDPPEVHTLQQKGPLQGSSNTHIYTTPLPGTRPVNEYTVRARASLQGAHTPLEAKWILWQH